MLKYTSFQRTGNAHAMPCLCWYCRIGVGVGLLHWVGSHLVTRLVQHCRYRKRCVDGQIPELRDDFLGRGRVEATTSKTQKQQQQQQQQQQFIRHSKCQQYLSKPPLQHQTAQQSSLTLSQRYTSNDIFNLGVTCQLQHQMRIAIAIACQTLCVRPLPSRLLAVEKVSMLRVNHHHHHHHLSQTYLVGSSRNRMPGSATSSMPMLTRFF